MGAVGRPTLGIRREDKNEWERRVPLTPDAVRRLVEGGIDVVVQPSAIRIFADQAFRSAGALVEEDLGRCDVVLAIKEIPVSELRPGGVYAFFSHTIKGQPHNMPMLRRMMELGCTLIDYERIVDDNGIRLVFFGRHAGLAGMIDTLWLLGRRLESLGSVTPFRELRLAHEYDSLQEARRAVADVGARLRTEPLPKALVPLVIGVAGYGNVSRGAQEILDVLPLETIEPAQLAALAARRDAAGDRVFKVVFHERDMVEPTQGEFVLADYYAHPDRYRASFERHARHLSVLVNAIFWTSAYPRLLTNDMLRSWWTASEEAKLVVVGDISCDLEGAIECTVKPTTPGLPAYVYMPTTGAVTDGWQAPGLAMMTTDCLPCELSREASESFTEGLLPLADSMARVDPRGSFEHAELPSPIKKATILWRGDLTPDYRYMAKLV